MNLKNWSGWHTVIMIVAFLYYVDNSLAGLVSQYPLLKIIATVAGSIKGIFIPIIALIGVLSGSAVQLPTANSGGQSGFVRLRVLFGLAVVAVVACTYSARQAAINATNQLCEIVFVPFDPSLGLPLCTTLETVASAVDTFLSGEDGGTATALNIDRALYTTRAARLKLVASNATVNAGVYALLKSWGVQTTKN